MKVVGSVIARLGSKRLTYKNILPYQGEPLARRALRKLLESEMFDEVILSTDSELIAYTCQMEGVRILQRPETLSGDDVASVPVFRHIVENFPCDIHLNYNCNFPVCDSAVFTKAIELARESGESLSVPYAVWAQTVDCLKNYDDPMKITASRFETELVHSVDIHTMDDLLAVHRDTQKRHAWENIKKMVKF